MILFVFSWENPLFFTIPKISFFLFIIFSYSVVFSPWYSLHPFSKLTDLGQNTGKERIHSFSEEYIFGIFVWRYKR